MALTKINASVIANNTIAVGNIADNSVDATKIASSSILTRHIDDDQVTEAKLANAINTSIAAKLPLAGGTMTGTLTVGVDDAGHDVKFFGDTASAYMLWDASADDLILGGAAGISAQALTASGVTKLNGGVIFNEDSADLDFRVESNGNANMLFVDGGGDSVNIGTTTNTYNAALVVNNESGELGFDVTDGTTHVGIWGTGALGTIGTRSNHSLSFKTNDGERMRIHANGKAAWSANGIGDPATIARDFAFYTEGSTNGLEVRSNDQRLLFFGANGSGGTGVDDGYLAMSSQGTGTIAFNANGASYFNGGKVGIGTTSPLSHLTFESDHWNTGTEDGPSIRWNNGITTADSILQSFEDSNVAPFVLGMNAYIGSGGSVEAFNSSYASNYIYQAASGVTIFGNAASGTPSERVRIQSGGGISFNGDSAAANALDDYEEGSWTIGISSSDPGSMSVTVSNSYGWYVKVGKLVTLGGSFDLSTSSPQGTMRITGLPFACSANGTRPLFVGSVGYTINIVPQPHLVTLGNGSSESYLDVWKQGNNSRYNISDFNNGGRMNFQISYETA